MFPHLLTLALCFFFTFLSFTSLAHAGGGGSDEPIDDPDVVVLTEADFDSFVNGHDLALVEFYAPWCGHCKALAPEYAKAATILKSNDPPVALAKVDATKESALAGRFGVSGYPTLKIFRNGKDSEYKGPRKTDGIVSYMKKQVGPAAKVVTSDAELKSLLKKDPNVQYVVAGFFQSSPQSQLQTSFSLLANTYRDDYIFAKITDHPELNSKYGIDEQSEGLVVFLFGEAKKYEGSSRRSDLEDFIKENSVPLIGVINSENTEVYSKKKLPIGKVFMKVEIANFGSKHLKYYTNRLAKIAEEYKNQIQIVLADKNSLKSEAEHFNVQDDEFSFVISDSIKNTAHRYDAPDEEKIGKFDPQGYKEFIELFLKGDAPKYVKSQRAPSKNNGSVKTVVGTTFEDLVLDDEKDVMIEFYAPWCGHCKALEPKYKEVGDKFKGNDDVVIAKMDATANDWDRKTFEVKGYPTIFFKPAGKKAVLYEGPRETTDMVNFIKKKGKYAKKSKKNDDDDEEEVQKKSKKKTKKNKKRVDDDEDDD